MKNELKNMPYSVPDGYFRDLSVRLQEIPHSGSEVTAWVRFRPYVAMAAALAVMVTAGTALLQLTTRNSSYEDFEISQYATLMSYYESEDIQPSPRPSDEDIREYLIETGVSAYHIEYEDYERDR